MSPPTHHMALDANLVNAITTATQEVLSTMAQTEATLQSVNAQSKYTPAGDLSAIIGITGESGEGMLSLSFGMNLATLIVSRLLGVAPGKITSEDRADAIGELANMVSGKAKMALMHEGSAPYKLSLPTLILGNSHEVSSHPKNVPFLVLTFAAEGETFYLQVSFRLNH